MSTLMFGSTSNVCECDNFDLCDYFDVFAGMSTWRILAMLLFSMDEAKHSIFTLTSGRVSCNLYYANIFHFCSGDFY